ncbi:putative proton-dependent oligopeptide transporter family, MFS transporter superfamily [Helianthus annuus]|uniref:Proton-dependent oligopeptide transporter family, MFS transporter superfamily n=1 Tax=Helianthus annuus TaxID=4232 RepID=A0A251TY24_HELAN|nr:protein NRT1/ PTR FAMILY 4.4 [Helianthus annuus]KAF5792208.1 putative proton-dependent oligopeptide transporter family, MFS transporter superfamily [Helianthus annuus]KAJ0527176.1 putative proton-dependent oligopeptide transporter family, MFS transporter superfamily [Helianthus annuus]KAJ0535823.1 putative proton-dependent oligopeptide transporter family, MFS transporter superfamily [Helianthus annuus]KAJ0543578.1 putative proton-dependent oligopeptide transporter family, MFS transporter sup
MSSNKVNNYNDEPCVDDYVDWRDRPSKPSKHGGMRAALAILGLQAFEMMAIAAVGNNLITYVFNEMHFPLSKSANVVTNFVGTVFLLSLLGGFLSDSYLGSYRTMLLFGFIELSGFILLSIQAHLPQMRPPKCDMVLSFSECEEAHGLKKFIFFTAVYLVALGSGCLKPNIISLAADQFRKKESKKLSTYFNCAYFAFCIGELIALTVLVWVQTHSGMDIGFGVSAAAMAVGLICLLCGTPLYRNKPTSGSIFTPIAQVFVAAITKRKQVCPSSLEMLHGSQSTIVLHHNVSTQSPGGSSLLHTDKFRFLDKACIKIQDDTRSNESPWRLCTVSQVEQVKILLSVVPIFACTIIFNTILAQLQTFSVQQGSAMNTKLTSNFQIPPASLQSIPYVMLVFLVPLYETAFVPMSRKITGRESGISPLQRVGVGLFIATFSMVSAAIVENKRRTMALRDPKDTISIFWIAPQFLVFGVSEMFTAVGLIEFFYKQSVEGMQSFLTAMTYCSYSFGFYLSSLLVSLVNKVTSRSGHGGWLSDNNLNNDRLDLFYWLLAGLSFINFFNYLFWSRWYCYNPSLVGRHASPSDVKDSKVSMNDIETG